MGPRRLAGAGVVFFAEGCEGRKKKGAIKGPFIKLTISSFKDLPDLR